MYYVKVFLGFLQFYINAAFIGPKLKPALLELETWQPSPTVGSGVYDATCP